MKVGNDTKQWDIWALTFLWKLEKSTSKRHSQNNKTVESNLQVMSAWKQKWALREKEYSTSRPLEHVHIDLCGLRKTKRQKREYYFILLIHDYTRMTWFSFLKNKS